MKHTQTGEEIIRSHLFVKQSNVSKRDDEPTTFEVRELRNKSNYQNRNRPWFLSGIRFSVPELCCGDSLCVGTRSIEAKF